ncbi:MAG TPA: hypothetical protein VE991_07945 [Acidimicrobiales bacterium]|nr:hypothetical protein [Acidimicrobiales bacterium]
MTDAGQGGGADAPEGEEDLDAPVAARRRWPFAVAALVLAAGLGVGLGLGLSGGSTPPAGPEGVPLLRVPDLAPADSTASGQPVDGITCRTSKDQTVKYHIHVYVAVYVNGNQVRLPAGAGIPPPRTNEHFATGLFEDNGFDGCLYWLHVHTTDDVVHVESPYKHTFTLGQFFDVWGQPLGRNQVGPAKGRVTAYENGTMFTGDPRDIPLLPHAVIQLDVGSPVVPFQPVQFTVSGLCGSGTEGCAA